MEVKVEKTRKKEKPLKNSLGISPQMIPRANKAVAIYRLLSVGDFDPLTNEEVLPPPAIIDSTYTLFDKFEEDPNGKHKIMRCIGGIDYVYNGQTKKNERVETLKTIMFEGGYLTINTLTDFNTFVFVDLHPRNKSNRFRNNYPNLGEPIFERVDKEYKNANTRLAEADLSLDAELAIRKMEYKDVKQYSEALGLTILNLRPEDVKLNLRTFARENPRKFLSTHPDKKIIVRLNVLDALSLGIIEYDADGRSFKIYDETEPFFKVLVGKEAEPDLIDYLCTEDGESDLKEIRKLLSEE